MAKKQLSKNKSRKPKEGDTVFLIGEKKHVAMHFRNKVIINGEELAYCTWVIPNIDDSNLSQYCLNWYPISLLTLEPPKLPTTIYMK